MQEYYTKFYNLIKDEVVEGKNLPLDWDDDDVFQDVLDIIGDHNPLERDLGESAWIAFEDHMIDRLFGDKVLIKHFD